MRLIDCVLRSGLLLIVCCWLTLHTGASAADEQPVNAGTPSKQQLRAPVERESFDFLIFGDRTGGPPEGIAELEQGVQMANRLDVDLVLTVGDLVEGYNEPEQWLLQMQEYKAVMSGLGMPWYPVPGNHDVYSRPKQPGGHTRLYTEHFGPLYYSFDYKWAHFIVLFSDEQLSFRNKVVDQNVSPEQMAWLRADLAATEASQLFVFLHHPRWTKEYEGCNWLDVHELFVEDGRAVTVFAGHIHIYRDDGPIDNVHYYTLATTGGWKGRYTDSAALHHVDFVRVRPDRVTVAVLPVGSVYGGDFVLGAEVDAMKELTLGNWLVLRGQAAVGIQPGVQSSLALTLSNPTDRAMRLSAKLTSGDGWTLAHRPIDQELAPGDDLTVDVRVTAPAMSGSQPRINVKAQALYPLRSGLVQPIVVQTDVPIELKGVAAAAEADPDNNGVLRLDGKSAVRVSVPERLERYTLECWVRGGEPKGRSALVTKTESSAYGIFWCDNGGTLPVGFVGTRVGYLELPAKEKWDWDRWTHVALVFDGHAAALYVNGKPQTGKTTDAAATHNRHPLYIGADPDRRGQPVSFFTGAIDEVRLSSLPRYDGPFTPQPIFASDRHTIALFHFDRTIAGVFLDDSGTGHHGWGVGEPKIERVQR